MEALDPLTEKKIDDLYPHEIKAKRIKKQIINLSSYQLPTNVSIGLITITSIGIRIPLILTRKGKQIPFQIRLDREYPFNRPQVHCIDKNNSFISEARDLLDLQLQPNTMWGPSLMLTEFIERLSSMMQKIDNSGINIVHGRYWLNDEFLGSQLEQKGLKLYNATQNEWKYMIKKSHPRIVAVGAHVLLILSPPDAAGIMNLLSAIFIKDIKKVTSNTKTGDIEIGYAATGDLGSEGPNPAQPNTTSNKQSMVYLVIEEQSLDKVLEVINRIQMLERQVQESEAKGDVSESIINKYSQLVEYYSVRNPSKSNEYLVKMKESIKKTFQQPVAS